MLLATWATLTARLRGRPRHPAWSFSFEVAVRYLRLDWEQTASWDFRKLRGDMDRRPYPRNYAKKVRQEDAELGGIPVRRFVPPQRSGVGCVLCLHGGSYIFGSAGTSHCELMAHIAHDTGLEVLGLEYRLVPEHRYPAQLEDALAAFSAVTRAGTAADEVIVVGDSSGGNLALALSLALRDAGEPQPAALALISPWSDLEMPGRSFEENDPYDFGTRDALLRHARAFAGELPLSDPRISPLRANLKGLPPCLVVVSELEIPRDDIEALARALEKAGVDVALHLARHMPHNAPTFAAYDPEGKAALDAVVSFVRAHAT